MKKIAALLFLLITAPLYAQDNKPRIQVGGTFYLYGHYDSYKSVESRDGLSYSYPLAPNLDPDGRDLNKAGQFNLSVYATRLHVDASGFKLLNADARLYVETDFMGSSSDFLQMIRLRHAYLDLRWERDELLLGQTNNIEYPAEVISGVLTSGAGSPIAILSRPVMIRYGRVLGDRWKAYAAVSYHHVQASGSHNPETKSANRNSGLPSFEGRIQYGSADRIFAGVSGGYKLLRPRLETDGGYRASSTIGSASVSAFLRANCHGHTFKAQGVYGSNLSHLSLIGGYGKRADSDGEDYDYTNLKTMSVWGDFETKPYRYFRFGVFGGYMENLGSVKEIDPAVIYARHAGLSRTGRISPRVTWSKEKIVFGVEYSYFLAKWGETFDEHYQPVTSYETTVNHRVTLMVKYAF